jgi:hypothetical protein
MQPHSPIEVLRVFLKPGLSSFGGPIAHIGYFREEFVVEQVEETPSARSSHPPGDRRRPHGWQSDSAGVVREAQAQEQLHPEHRERPAVGPTYIFSRLQPTTRQVIEEPHLLSLSDLTANSVPSPDRSSP